MNKYYIHKIEHDGKGRCILEIEAHTITAAWLSSRPWFTDGTYYVIRSDGYDGQQYTINRKQEATT